MKAAESREQSAADTALGEPDTISNDFPQEEIALLAYSYWEARGHQGGSAEEDWLRAEQKLRDQRSQGKAEAPPREVPD